MSLNRRLWPPGLIFSINVLHTCTCVDLTFNFTFNSMPGEPTGQCIYVCLCVKKLLSNICVKINDTLHSFYMWSRWLNGFQLALRLPRYFFGGGVKFSLYDRSLWLGSPLAAGSVVTSRLHSIYLNCLSLTHSLPVSQALGCQLRTWGQAQEPRPLSAFNG